MKKSLLLLTGLLALSATAMAEDATVAAPATPAAPAQFKAHGSYSGYLKAYSNKSYNKKASDGTGKTVQNSKLKLYNYADAYVAENTYVSVENINYFNYPGYDRDRSSETTVDFNHSSGKIGSTELEFSQNLEYDRSGTADTYEYAPNVDFSSYLGDGNSGYFELEFDHVRNDGQKAYTASQSVGYDLDTTWDLGAGFGAEAELDGTFYGRDLGAGHKTTNKNNSHSLDLGVYYSHDLYKANTNTISVYGELYADATLSNSKDTGKSNVKSRTSSLSSESYINFAHQVNSATKIYLRPGVLLGKGLTTNDNDKAARSDYRRSHAQLYLRAGFSVTL